VRGSSKKIEMLHRRKNNNYMASYLI